MHTGGVSGGGGGSYGKKDPLEELVANSPSDRNWKGIAISLFVIGCVIGLVALAVVIVTPPDPGPRIKGSRIVLRDIVEKKYQHRVFNGTWVSGSSLVYENRDGGLTLHNVATGEISVIASNSTFRQLDSTRFDVSPSVSYALLAYEEDKVHRHSRRAKYAILNLNTSSYNLLSLDRSGSATPNIQAAGWAPKGHALVLVHDNDLFYMQDAARPNNIKRLTSSGREKLVFNGVADWLYEEEILSSSKAFWFSPEASHLLYASFDDSELGKMSFNFYASHRIDDSLPEDMAPLGYNLYPTVDTLSYPKVGTRNPRVSLKVINLSTFQDTILKPPPRINKLSDYYFTSVVWLDRSSVCVTWTNRLQNLSVISRCSLPKLQCQELHQEESGSGWIENTGAPLFSRDGSQMLMIKSLRSDSVYGAFPQVVQMKLPKDDVTVAAEPLSITHGTFHVTEIVFWDERKNMIYFISTLSESPGVRHLLRVGDASIKGTPEAAVTCITCPSAPVTFSEATMSNDSFEATMISDSAEKPSEPACTFNQIHMSLDGSHFVQECLGPSVPYTRVFSLSSMAPTYLLDGNAEVCDHVAASALPWTKTFEVPLPDSTIPARVKLTLPPGLREHEEFRFPLVVQLYGGPGTQEVNSKWSVDWKEFLSSQRDFIVAQMDVRGSGYSGDAFKHVVYRELGTQEAKDSLHVLKHLVNTVPYIDKRKVSVWGWSYGGFLAARMLTLDEEMLIHCTASVAPVTKWTLYDSAYTERYMGYPDAEDNWRGYTNSDLTEHASAFHDRPFLLVHSTADRNVHFQQSMVLTEALVEKNVQFKQQVYPDENHGLENVHLHLFSTLERFFRDCMGPIPDWFSIDCIEDGKCYV